MDSIKPEKDDVALHQMQKKRPLIVDERGRLPEAAVASRNSVSLSRSAQWALILIFLLVISLVGMGYWQVKQQQSTIQTLDNQLEEASTYISQSKLIVARLEGQINQTDATMAQSGNELARELKFLDSEVRKLWDVANKRNKEWIQNNQNSLKTVAAELDATNATAEEVMANIAKLEKSISRLVDVENTVADLKTGLNRQSVLLTSQQKQTQQQGELLTQQKMVLDQLQLQVKQDIKTLQIAGTNLNARQQAVADQLANSIADLEQKFAGQQKTVQALVNLTTKTQSEPNISRRLQALETTMTGLDKVRGQLVQRIVRLDARINEMQLELKALK